MNRLLFAVAATASLGVPGGASAAEPKAVVQGELDAALKADVQRVIGSTDDPIENRFEARRRARAAAEDAMMLLRSEGYYASVVEPDVSEADPPTPLVRVTPGPRFVLGEAGLEWKGDPPPDDIAAIARKAIGLTPGLPGRAVEVIAAEGRIVAALQSKGHADAEAQPRDVVVDHAVKTVTPTYRISAGQLVRLDGLQVTSEGRTRPDWLRRLAPWETGDAYDPEDVAQLERRLLDTGVYESVTVGLAPPDKATVDGLRPVLVSLGERRRGTLDAGASYSTSEGYGLDARWTRYNRLRRADTLALYGRISGRDSRAGVDLSLPHWRRPQQTLHTGTVAYRVRTDAYDETGAGVRADVTRRYGKTSYLTKSSYVTVGASLDVSRTEELQPGTLSPLGRDLITAALLGDVLLDRADDPLDPRRGWKLTARAEPTYVVGKSTSLPYLRVVAQGTYYQPLEQSAKTVVAGRLRMGRILNGTIPEVPASRRFYAGGGGSVRGFGYQDVGPRIDEDTPKGGVSLIETSVELRRDLSRQWGVAAFVDAGTVGSSGVFDLGDLAVGAGIGVRYTVGSIPVRIDVATPVTQRDNAPMFNVYISIGQSF